MNDKDIEVFNRVTEALNECINTMDMFTKLAGDMSLRISELEAKISYLMAGTRH